MKTTNTKHIVNEKLQGVDLPDMQSSWDQMDKMIDSQAPVTTGFSAFIGKYKLFLNVFLVSLTIGVIGLYVKSTNKKSDIVTPLSSDVSHQSAFSQEVMRYVATVDHTYDLPILAEPVGLNVFTSQEISGISTSVTRTTDYNRRPFDNLNIAMKKLQFDALGDYIIDDTIELKENSSITTPLVEDMLPTVRFVHNELGLNIQTALWPNSAAGDLLRNSGYSLFARRYISSQMALQIGIGYNPVPIRPISYVEEYNVFNNFNYTQTDSAVVNSLRYVSIPVNIYWTNPTRKYSFTFGPQFSFLSGLNGDMHQRFNYPGATEDRSVSENILIRNRGGFATTDFALNFEVGVRVKPKLALAFRFQQSLSDFSTFQLSSTSHMFQTLQIKAEWLLNK